METFKFKTVNELQSEIDTFGDKLISLIEEGNKLRLDKHKYTKESYDNAQDIIADKIYILITNYKNGMQNK